MKTSISILSLLIIISCNNKNEASISKVSTVERNKQIKDSISKVREQEVIDMDLSTDSEKTLKTDLEKFK